MTRTAWPEATAANELRHCPSGLLVGALRALVAHGNARLVRVLELHLSARVTRRLRK